MSHKLLNRMAEAGEFGKGTNDEAMDWAAKKIEQLEAMLKVVKRIPRETMTPAQLHLTAELLRGASDMYSNHGCNDWKWPADWSQVDRLAFAAYCFGADAEAVEYASKGEYGPPDWLVMEKLSDMLEEEAEKS